MSFIELFQSFIDRSRSAALVLAVSAPLALAGCGGGDDDKDEGGSGGNGDAVNMVGTWTVTETITDTCGGGSYTETFTFTITEESAGLVLEDEMEDTVVLQVNGNTATWSVNETTEEGSFSLEGTATFSGNNISGSSEWTIQADGFSCGGSSTFTGTRVSGDPGTGGNGGDDNGGLPTPDAMEVEPNSDMYSATMINMTGSTVTYGGFVSDGFDGEDYIDYFAFSPPVSGSYTITLKGDSAMDDIDMAVYDSIGAEIAESSTFGPNESVTLTLNAGLVYYIEVYGYETLQGSNYVLTVTRN